MRIIGIDPGSRVTGYGIVDALTDSTIIHVVNGVIKLSNKAPLYQKLKTLFDRVGDIINEYNPDTAAIEDLFVAKNAKSSLLLGHARATAMLALSISNMKVAEYTPSEVKKSVTGNGQATKEQVQKMISIMLKFNDFPTEDASDALAVAICHCNSMRVKNLINACNHR